MSFEPIKFWKSKDKETMNSIAIWWDKHDDIKVHIDVNIWHTKDSEGNYLEFGLKIENYKNIDDINIYIPYTIKESDIEDKAGVLASDNTLTNAMFNEKLEVSKGEGSFHAVKFPKDTKKNFEYCELDVKKDIKIEDKTIILNINKKATGEVVYYRFRIKKIEKIFTGLKENYFLIDGFFKTIGFIEVNINSVRKLPKNIVDKLDGVNFDSMNLFVMTDNFTNFIFQSKDVNKSRVLENHIWDKYLSTSNRKSINKIIAYHWKKEDKKGTKIIPFEDYNLFVKISYISKNWLLLALMIFIIVGLGAGGGVVGNLITTKYFNNFADKNSSQKTEVLDEPKDNKKGDNNAT